jgi:hypothetical protein
MDILLYLPASDKHLLMHFEFVRVLIQNILSPPVILLPLI